MPNIFDIEHAQHLFELLERRFDRYRNSTEKDTEDAILIIMVANHLREWIAPGYNCRNSKWPKAKSPAQKLSRRVYELPQFATIRALCNGTKHAKTKMVTDTKFETDVFAWSDFFKPKDFFEGVPIAHMVDDQPLESLIEPVMAFYRQWFNLPKARSAEA
jgi:hypothetical protein